MALRSFLSSAAGAVAASNLASGAVTTAKLASGAVDAAALGSGAVTTAKLASGAVDAAALASGAVTTAKLASAAVDAAALASGAVTTAKLASGAVDAAALASGAVTTAKLASGAVDAAAIGSGVITSAKMDMTASYNFTGTLQKSGVGVAAYTFGGTRGIEPAAGDGSTTVFDLAGPSPQVLVVFVDGAEQSLTTNYTYSATGGAGGVARVTFSAAPANGVDVEFQTIY